MHGLFFVQKELKPCNGSSLPEFYEIRKKKKKSPVIQLHFYPLTNKHSDIEFNGLFVREHANIKQDGIMRFLFHPVFIFFFHGGGGIGLSRSYFYVILSTAK